MTTTVRADRRIRLPVLVLTAALAGACGGSSGGGDTPDAAGSGADASPPDAPASGLQAIPLATPDGSFYTAQITVGTQTFAVDVDTGSTTLGVAATACTSCGVTPLYAPGASATDDMTTASTQYADGSRWSGEVYTDQVGFAHGTPTVGVSFVAISSQRQFFSGNDYQGIVGLGPDLLLEQGTSSYLTGAETQGLPGEMAFELCPAGGTMWLGGFDPAAAQAAPQYTPMLPVGNQNPFYAIDLTDLALGGTSLGLNAASFQEPIVDTGTTLVYLPSAVMTPLMSGINASSGFQALFPNQTISDSSSPPDYGCVTTAGVTAAQVDAMLPALSYSFPAMGGGTFTVEVPPTLSYIYDAGGGTFCLAFANGGNGGSTLGDVFLQAFVTHFDVAGGRLGLAPDAGCAAQRTARRVVRGPFPREHGHPPHRPGPSALRP